jgi:hypothetical protein
MALEEIELYLGQFLQILMSNTWMRPMLSST